jgi:membrane associated rhomboid family serine protease
MVSSNTTSGQRNRHRGALISSARPKSVRRVRPPRQEVALIKPPSANHDQRENQSSRQGKDNTIFQPPALQDGMQGRDRATTYDPYSPTNTTVTTKTKGYWKNSAQTPKNDNIPKTWVAPRNKYGYDDESAGDYRNMAAESSVTMDSSVQGDDTLYEKDSYYSNGETEMQTPHPTSPSDRLKKWYHGRFPVLSRSASTAQSIEETVLSSEKDPVALALLESDDYLRTKQDHGYCTIALTSVQLLVIMMQLSLCGVAPLDINPMIGPFPDAFSQWGGKNSYKMLMHNEWWRMFTPVFLHVGVIHLSLNVFCQLNAVAMFEREWGWRKWLIIFTCSTIGCQTFSNFFDQETIAVGSSGTLMGMFAGKLAHVFVFSFFDIVKNDVDEAIRMDQLSSVLCGLTIESFLGAFTYIEWSGNMGGLLCGFLSGMVVFSGQIYGCCTRFWTATISFLALIASIGAILYKFIEEAEPDEQLDNVCEYFRSFFPEGYECGCMWQ